MPSTPLTPNDTSVLTHIFDPESATTTSNLLIDASLPSDPHIRDPNLLKSLQNHEQQIISTIETQPHLSPTVFETAYDALTTLITANPTYASAHNNRAQLIRLRYGNSVLVQPASHSAHATDDQRPNTTALLQHAHTALTDLNHAIALLTPPGTRSPTPPPTISPLQRKTLAKAHTQRAALFHAAAAAKALSSSSSSSAPTAPITKPPTTKTTLLFAAPDLEKWTTTDFEEAASRDFRMAGLYGSEMGRVLGVAVNPTARLCGEIVGAAMRREVGVGGGVV